jgi:hypothetical protein
MSRILQPDARKQKSFASFLQKRRVFFFSGKEARRLLRLRVRMDGGPGWREGCNPALTENLAGSCGIDRDTSWSVCCAAPLFSAKPGIIDARPR